MTKQPKAPAVIVANIPDELKQLRRWVAWRYEQRDDRWTKVPVSSVTGAGADSTNPADWTSFEEALSYSKAQGLAGVGFVFAEGDGYCGVDLDGCLDPDKGTLEEWAAKIIAKLETYAEISPSLTGVKLFMRGKVPGPRRRKGPIELYHSGRYFTVTGAQLPGVPSAVENRQSQLDWLYRYVFEEVETKPAAAAQDKPTTEKGFTDEQIVQKAGKAKNGEKFQKLWGGDWSDYGSQSEADQALCCLLVFWTGPDPERIDRLFRLSGLYREKWERDDYRQRTIETAIGGCTKTYKPMDEEELEGSALDLMMAVVQKSAVLFHTPDENVPFATVMAGEHLETWTVESTGFRHWLLGTMYRGFQLVPKTHQVEEALQAISARACFDGQTMPLHVRVAGDNEAVYVDLGDPDWQAVEVTAKGWRVVDCPQVRFRRPKGMKALPIPESGGSVKELRPFLNLATKDDFRLVVAWLVMALRPKGPYPLLCIHGEQGSCKSTLARLLRDLVDPVKARLRKEPHEVRDLMIAASNSHVLAYDNMSSIEPWLSDALCVMATGGGFSTRMLYTDDEEKIFEVCRPMVVTGICELATRPDLLDRAIVLNLPVVPEEKRRREEDLFADFEQARPRIFGALLDGVAAALANQEAVVLDSLPRMADFALWATAAESAFGWPEGSFMWAYKANTSVANEIALDDSVIVPYLRKLLAATGAWPAEGETRATEDLLRELVMLVGGQNAAHRLAGWPHRPRDLAGILRRLAPVLRRTGVFVEFLARETSGNRRRPVRIWTQTRPE